MQSHPIHTRHHPHVTAEPVAPALRTDAVGIDAHVRLDARRAHAVRRAVVIVPREAEYGHMTRGFGGLL